MRIYKRGVLAAALAGCLSLALTATTIAEHGRSQGSPRSGLRIHVEGLAPGHTFGIDQVYKGFWCNGGNQSPALRISGVPTGTGSLAITIFDPDAPTQSGWWHWLVYDLPASTTDLAENASAIPTGHAGALPASAAQGPNDFGGSTPDVYGGVCPPQGAPAHHYRVTVWALPASSLAQYGVNSYSSAAYIDYVLEGNATAHDTEIVKYGD